MRILVLAGLFFLFTFSFLVGASRNTIANDSPWLEIGDEVSQVIAQKKPEMIESILERKTPGAFWKKLVAESKSTQLIPLWGTSINFDENAKGIIVAPELLDLLFGKFNTPARQDRIVHAGIEHVYGYLFSNLKTPFGYKRARWVDGDLERGFGLPTGILSPTTKDGALFSNVSAFFGRIGFSDSPARLAVLDADRNAASLLKNFSYATLQWKRLRESTTLADGTKITLQTDFVPFTHERGANAALLLYTVFDSRQDGPKLISGFPVAQSFVDRAIDPSGLGTQKDIITRYNIFVPGFTGALKGKREVISIHE